MSEQLFQNVINWANAEQAVRVIIIEGSRARPDQSIDRFSDYDLNLYLTDLTKFITDDSWIEQIGSIWALEKETDPSGESSRLVLFEGGHDIDFKLLPITTLYDYAQEKRLPDDYHRGYKVVLDKEGITSRLIEPSFRAVPKPKPTPDEFLYAVSVFWFELFHLVKYLHRGDLWSVKFRDAGIKRRLLQMIEWHALAIHDWDYDTWIVGKHMASWVEPKLWQAFFNIFAHFDKADSWRAVCALMPLYRRIATETAERLKYAYPYEMDNAISKFLLDNSPV